MNCTREQFTRVWENEQGTTTQFDQWAYDECVRAWNDATRTATDYRRYSDQKLVESNVAKRNTINAVTQALRDLQNPSGFSRLNESPISGWIWIIGAAVALFIFLRR